MKPLPVPIMAGSGVVGLGWRAALPALIVALLAIIGLYWPTAVGMAAIWWRSETFAHGMLVLPIVLYMIWTRRRELAVLEPRGAVAGLGLLLLLGLGWLVADAAEVVVMQQLALVGLLQATVYVLLGGRVVWAIAFPLTYLLFAVPVGEALIPPLQRLTAWFAVEGLRWTGIPVLWEGLYIVVPSGSFEVAEACSGLRYLIASVALGFLYVYLSYRGFWRRLAFVALSVAMPLVANGIRAYGIVMIAHLSDMKYAVGFDHLIYGWFFFGVVVLLMFWIGSFWREPTLAGGQGSEVTAQTLVLGGDLPLAPHFGRYASLALMAVLAAAVGSLGTMWMNRGGLESASVTLQAPPAVAPWQGPERDTGDWEPRFGGADAVGRSRYRLEGRTVHLYIAYYRQQRPDAKLVSTQNSLYDGKRWRYAGSGGQVQTGVAGAEWPFQATLLTDGERRLLAWSGYWEGGRLVISPYLAKLWEAWDRLSGVGRGSALVAVAAGYEVRPDEAAMLLERFLAVMGPGIAATLDRASGRGE